MRADYSIDMHRTPEILRGVEALGTKSIARRRHISSEMGERISDTRVLWVVLAAHRGTRVSVVVETRALPVQTCVNGVGVRKPP
jgi:hypothetical protein